MMSFNAAKSKTILGAIIGVIVYLAGAYQGDGSLDAQEIGTAVSILLVAFGVREAIAKNGSGQ